MESTVVESTVVVEEEAGLGFILELQPGPHLLEVDRTPIWLGA